jgi:hypothetical protein
MVDIERAGLTNRPQSNRKVGISPIYDRKRELVKMLSLEPIYTPRVYTKSRVKIRDKNYFVVQAPEGRILGVHPEKGLEGVKTPSKTTRFYDLDKKIRIKDFRKRVETLSDLLYKCAAFGIDNYTLKALKRLSVIGFSCPMEKFLQISNYIYRKLYMVGARKRTRRPDYIPKGCMYPSFNGGWKRIYNGCHIKVPTWGWKRPITAVVERWD